MRVIITSERLPPSRGGLSTVAQILATGLAERGHFIELVTTEKATASQFGRFRVLRLSSIGSWINYLKMIRLSDVVLQNNVSLKTLWLPFILGKPTVVSLHIWLENYLGNISWKERLKRTVLRRVSLVVTPNMEILKKASLPGRFVRNGYDDSVFFSTQSWDQRPLGIVCVARLVPEKGILQMLRAFVRVAHMIPSYCVTIVGEGPERTALEEYSRSSGLEDRIIFTGSLEPREIARILNSNRLMVVPSLWDEIFGLVALEGLACGLPSIVTNHAGLVDAQHGHGIVVEAGDGLAEQLGTALVSLAGNSGGVAEMLRGADAYLATRTKDAIIGDYESALSSVTHV